jgi:hypothetical protein
MLMTEAAAAVPATGSVRVLHALAGPRRRVALVGAFPTSLLLSVGRGEVVAVLTSDAVRLPVGLVVPWSSRTLPLTDLGPEVWVGASSVWAGDRPIRLTTPVSVQAPTGLVPGREATERARRLLRDHEGIGEVDAALARRPSQDSAGRGPTGWVHRLVGAGPGLTPAGDDVLAGYLVAGWAFGRDVDAVRAAVVAAAPARTTDFSAGLLRCAAEGESIPQVDALLTALASSHWEDGRLDTALAGLLRVGHTSGAAMATGVLLAVHRRARRRTGTGRRAGAADLSAASQEGLGGIARTTSARR